MMETIICNEESESVEEFEIFSNASTKIASSGDGDATLQLILSVRLLLNDKPVLFFR